MQRILIAHDGSAPADAALDDLERAGLPPALEVLVLSVADVYLPAGGDAAAIADTPDMPTVMKEARERSIQILNAHRDIAGAACQEIQKRFPRWNCTSEAVADSPAWGVLKRASEAGSELIVLGSHSHSKLQHFFLGSVAQRVAAEARCSVRIARAVSGDGPLRLVLALDGSPASEKTLQAVLARPWPARTELRVLSVISARVESTMAWPSFRPDRFGQSKGAREWLRAMLDDAFRRLGERGLSVSTDVFEGDPKDVLVRVCTEWNAHCLFIGATGMNHGSQRTIGTVASSLANKAPCSVEIVR